LIAAEVVHGIARTVWLAPVVGDFHARQIAVFSGSLLIMLIVSVTIRWMRVPTKRLLFAIGLLWAVLTVGFESGFGRLVLDSSWNRLASDYDLPAGGLLPDQFFEVFAEYNRAFWWSSSCGGSEVCQPFTHALSGSALGLECCRVSRMVV
jgi:hypothetical protein